MRKRIILAMILLGTGIFFGHYLGTFQGTSPLIVEKIDLSVNFNVVFFNNLITCLIIIASFGVVTVPITILQGIYIGFSAGIMASQTMSNSYLLLILPHAIFELPALICSVALGLETFYIAKKFFSGEKINLKFYCYKKRRYLFSIVILLFLAAMIECFITPKIYQSFGGIFL